MKKFILLLLVATKVYSQTTVRMENPDRNTLHIYAGMAISAGVGAYVYSETKRPFLSSTIGFATGCLVGIGKEAIYDKMMKLGTCSNADAYKTFWGAAVGSICLRVGIDMKEKHDLEKEYFQHMGDSLNLNREAPILVINR